MKDNTFQSNESKEEKHFAKSKEANFLIKIPLKEKLN